MFVCEAKILKNVPENVTKCDILKFNHPYKQDPCIRTLIDASSNGDKFWGSSRVFA